MVSLQQAISDWEMAPTLHIDTTPDLAVRIGLQLQSSANPGAYVPRNPDDKTAERRREIGDRFVAYSSERVFMPAIKPELREKRKEALAQLRNLNALTIVVVYCTKGENPLEYEGGLCVLSGLRTSTISIPFSTQDDGGSGEQHPRICLRDFDPKAESALAPKTKKTWDHVRTAAEILLRNALVKPSYMLDAKVHQSLAQACLDFAHGCLSDKAFQLAACHLRALHRLTLDHPPSKSEGPRALGSHHLLLHNANRASPLLVADFLSPLYLEATLSSAARHVKLAGSLEAALQDPTWFCVEVARKITLVNPSVSKEGGSSGGSWFPTVCKSLVVRAGQNSLVAEGFPFSLPIETKEVDCLHTCLNKATEALYATLPAGFVKFTRASNSRASLSAESLSSIPLSSQSSRVDLEPWMHLQLRAVCHTILEEEEDTAPLSCSARFALVLQCLSLLAHVGATPDVRSAVGAARVEGVLGEAVSPQFGDLLLVPAALEPSTLLYCALFLFAASAAGDYPRSSIDHRGSKASLKDMTRSLCLEAGNPPYIRDREYLEEMAAAQRISLHERFQTALGPIVQAYNTEAMVQ